MLATCVPPLGGRICGNVGIGNGGMVGNGGMGGSGGGSAGIVGSGGIAGTGGMGKLIGFNGSGTLKFTANAPATPRFTAEPPPEIASALNLEIPSPPTIASTWIDDAWTVPAMKA